MKFLVDAQLPRLLSIRPNELGQQAGHTFDLPEGNATTDRAIADLADSIGAVVITKDADFLNSHLIYGKPTRLLLVSTGNIANRKLLGLFEIHVAAIVRALESSSFVELTSAGLVIHE
ncbi:MAG: DUF5615 family PIN-like protein [Verrucomicrobiales bacterium]